MRYRIGRPTGVRERALLAVASLVASLGGAAVAVPAMAAPTGEFAAFADCPTTTPGVVACIYAKTESGQFTIGKNPVPIEKPIILQGGLREKTETELEFVAAKDGNTLTKAPQNVPGGLTGHNCTENKGSGFVEMLKRNICKRVFENGLTAVTATTELAGPASSIKISLGSLLSQQGAALELPLKVHLENPLLGRSCYIGSNAAPILVPLTTGTTAPPLPNSPIKGNTGIPEFIEGGEILRLSNNSLVENAFAAPKASGCGGFLEFLIGPIINSSLGLPSAAGHNTAILNGTLEQTAAETIKQRE